MNILDYIKIVLTGVGTAIGYFLGGFDIMLIALIIFMIIDYITGIMCAIINHKLSSSVGFKGIFKKIAILLLIGMSTELDLIFDINLIRFACISFYLSNEGISILENVSIIGLPVPNKIKDVLIQLKEKSEKTEEE